MRRDRQFQFSNAEIRTHSVTAEVWGRFVRLREIEMVLSVLGDRRFERALEIGAGNGLQSERLAARCGHLICSDVDQGRWDEARRRGLPDNVSFVVLDATDLSRFPDGSFDLVYSSNVLEHVEHIERCLRETDRVLKPSGLGVHAMPSRFWKSGHTLFRVVRSRMPRIHGVERTNWREFVAFGLSIWLQEFERAGFAVESICGMPFYFGAGGRFQWLVKLGNRLRIPSSYTVFLRPRSASR